MKAPSRTGTISFGDASLCIWEEPRSEVWGPWGQAFKREVFARIVQQLNRLGWTCTVPADMVVQYGLKFARQHRYCVKGDLKADLEVSGRAIKLQVFQSVHCPTRPDHEGRYESNKEACMSYLQRLEMERTRRRIRDYVHETASTYFAYVPGMPRKQVSARRRQQRLQVELDKAVKAMNFERAAVLRDILHPKAVAP